MTRTIPNLCGSVAANPSPLGVRLHTAGYQSLGLDYQYLAIGTDDLSSVLQALQMLSFRGLGVSMPFKQSVIQYLDRVNSDVTAIGACNTVVHEEGKLVGYNTDWLGALGALDEAGIRDISTAVIIGAGGVARAIGYALKQRNVTVFVSARSLEQGERLVHELGLDGVVSLADQGGVNASLVVNATPIGDWPGGPVDLDSHKEAKGLLDVIFQHRRTPLVVEAEARGLKVAPGWRMLLHQAFGQFRLYTGQEPPQFEMSRVLEDALPE